jgi:DNA-binding MarR family transcriptional regulator
MAMPLPIPSNATITAWARLIRAHNIVFAAVEGELKAAGFPPLAWYDVLLELRRSGGSLRPLEVERHLLLAQHNVSRLVDRLEKARFVKRLPVEGDARAQIIAITDEGRDLLTRMWPAYAAAIQKHVGDRLDSEIDATQLSHLLARLTQSEK